MNNQIRPGAIAIIVGGVLTLISSFLDWFGIGRFGRNAYETDLFGLTGIFLLLLSVAVIAVAAIGAFAPQVNLPANIVGFTLNQVVLVVGVAIFLWGFSLMLRENSDFGTILAWIGGTAIVAGAFLEDRAGAGSPASSGGPARPF